MYKVFAVMIISDNTDDESRFAIAHYSDIEIANRECGLLNDSRRYGCSYSYCVHPKEFKDCEMPIIIE